MLTKGLEQCGFSQSTIDPYLFTRDNCIMISYVDNCLIFYKNKSVLEELILSLKDEFKLTNEGDLTIFLGVNINKTWYNTLELI